MGPVWLIALACAIPIGVNGTWGTSLDLILDPVGVGQTEVGWIGFYATIAGGIAILIIAKFSDMFIKHMKLFLICSYICGAATLLWFDLICAHVLQYSKVQLYASCILGALFSNCGMPLLYELICETSYPIGEGISGAFLTILSNLSGVMFLLVLQIPNIGTTWMNWALLGSIVMGLLCLLAFPETYGRTNLDIVIKSYTDMVSDFPKAGSSSSELTADCVNTSIAT